MKYRIFLVFIGILAIIASSCEPYKTLQIETMEPAKVEFPGNFNKIVFANLATDVNNDSKTDTLLYHIITGEMSLGFIDAIKISTGIDSAKFLYLKGYPNYNKFYENRNVSWDYLEELAKESESDIFIVLDSMNLSMQSDSYTEIESYPIVHHRYRVITVNIYWSLYDIIEKKRLDQYYYNDTLEWESSSYTRAEMENQMPSVERSIRETSYFSAVDYANRVFPGWQSETRYYFDKGNKDFKLAATHLVNENWDEAKALWEKHIDSKDPEIASRACFNLAFVNELLGNINIALAWAQKSKEIKNKTRTRYYISTLKTRKKNLEKLQKQIY